MKVMRGEGDFDIRFDCRTLVVECHYSSLVDAEDLARRTNAAGAGPKLMMVCGTIAKVGLGMVTKTFINTDEDEMVVANRFIELRPKPKSVAVDFVDIKDAKKVWSKLQNLQGN